MEMVRKATWVTGFLCLLLVSGGQLARAQFGQMQGTVKGEDGKPLVGAIISIDRQDISGHYHVKTNKHGRFFYAGLPLGVYSVSVMRDGKKFFTLSGIRTSISKPATVDIDLQQEKMRSEAQASGIQVNTKTNKLTKEQMAEIQAAAKKREEEVQKRKALTGKFNGAMQAMKDAKMAANSKNYAEANQDYDNAITQFQAAAQVDPTQHVIFAQLGEAYSGKASIAATAADKQGFYDKSVAAYQKALSLKPNDASYHNNYALALANEGKVDEAEAELVKAAQLDPTNSGRYYFNLGAVLVNKNHMKEAADAFKKATVADPTFADAYYQLGVALMGMAKIDSKTGKVTPAPGTVAALEKYIQLAPNGPNAAAAKGLLSSVTGAVSTSYGAPGEKRKKK